MTPWLAAAAVAALSGSPHCLGMCGPLACAAGERAPEQIAYHTGRLLTYTALGAAAGALSASLPGPGWLGAVLSALMLVVFSASLGGLLPEPALLLPSLARVSAALARRADLPSRLLFGAASGLLPCGLVYATLSLAAASGGTLSGAAVMAVFGACTVPVLAAATFGLRRLLSRSLPLRRGLAAVLLVSGLSAIGLRSGLFAGDLPDNTPPCHAR